MKKLCLICFLCLWSFGLQAAPQADFQSDGVFLSDFNTAELDAFFHEILYDKAIDIEANSYPRVFVRNLPADFASMKDLSERNRLFIQILAPLAFKINEEILAEREELETLRDGRENANDFDEIECAFLEAKAKKYDVFTPFKDTRRCMRYLTELLERVDVVPPSVFVASAAIHTDWGTSRPALLANNLYQQRVWYTNEGLASETEPDEPYRFKVYKSLEDSMRDYALKLNSDINYSQFRDARKELKRRSDVLYGLKLSWAFVSESNLQNYAGLLDYVMTFYQFEFLDEAELDPYYDFKD